MMFYFIIPYRSLLLTLLHLPLLLLLSQATTGGGHNTIVSMTERKINVIVDQAYNHLKIYSQIPSVFTELCSYGFKLALISQSSQNFTVCQLIDFFNLRRFLSHMEIYPGNKTEHFEALHIKEDLWYGEMLYLVAEYEDVEPIADLGVACILVDEGGITMKDVGKGFHIFSTESPEYSYSEDTHESSYLFTE